MLGEVFYWLFNMSILASVVGLIVFALRAFSRLPRRFACWLWVIPFLRLWIPVGIGNPWSMMTFLSRLTTRTVVIWEQGNFDFTMTNMIMAANGYFPVTYRVNLLENLFRVASVVWLIVTIAILLTFAFLYVTTQCELRDAVHWRENLYLSDKVTSPALYGVIHPRIILPYDWKDREELGLILAHETAHAHHGDNFWRVLAFITAALHWFNPLVWLFLRTYLSDLELFCDERVLKQITESNQKAYALALVNNARCIREKKLFASSFGGAKIRVRVNHILNYRRISVFSTVCCMALILAIAYVLLTNAK